MLVTSNEYNATVAHLIFPVNSTDFVDKNQHSWVMFHKQISSQQASMAEICIQVQYFKNNYKQSWEAACVVVNRIQLSPLFMTIYQNSTYFLNFHQELRELNNQFKLQPIQWAYSEIPGDIGLRIRKEEERQWSWVPVDKLALTEGNLNLSLPSSNPQPQLTTPMGTLRCLYITEHQQIHKREMATEVYSLYLGM